MKLYYIVVKDMEEVKNNGSECRVIFISEKGKTMKGAHADGIIVTCPVSEQYKNEILLPSTRGKGGFYYEC